MFWQRRILLHGLAGFLISSMALAMVLPALAGITVEADKNADPAASFRKVFGISLNQFSADFNEFLKAEK